MTHAGTCRYYLAEPENGNSTLKNLEKKMSKKDSVDFQEMEGQEPCRGCTRLPDKTDIWKQMLFLTACIMGVLVVLSVALVVILTRFHPFFAY